MTGPPVPLSRTPDQTATINGSSSSNGPGFQIASGCSTPSSVTYLAWNGEQPLNGGGFLSIPAGTQNVTIEYNWIHGVNGTDPGSGQSRASNGILLDGPNAIVTNNITIKWNIFGSTSESDCGTLMNDDSLDEINSGGFCNGVGLYNNLTNIFIENNIFQFLEQGIKFYLGAGECNNCVIDYNDFTNIHRIPVESQAGYSSTVSPQPTLMYVQFNDVHTPYAGNMGSFGFSMANGCNYPSASNPTNCITHTDENVLLDEILIDSLPGGYIPEAIEEWGGDGTSASANLIQGYWANGIVWAQNGQFIDNDNNMLLYFGNYQNGNFVSGQGVTNCNTAPGGWWNNEDVTSGYTPTCVGNTFAGQYPGPPTGVTTSATPTISPASGSFMGSQTVTFSNPAANRDANTGIWYTTDGSTPVPGAGTAEYIASGGTIAVSTTTTVKAVGMWGAQNQPPSYAPGYGYVPSAMVVRVYTLCEAPTPPTLVSAYLSSKGGATTMTIGGTLQFTAYGNYSDGSVSALPDAEGEELIAWNTSNHSVAKVSTLGHVTAMGAGTAQIEAMIGTIKAVPFEVTVSAAETSDARADLATATQADLTPAQPPLAMPVSGPVPAAPGMPVQDAFLGPLWTSITPAGGSTSISNGHLFISVPGGGNHDPLRPSNQAARAVQTIGNDDFDVSMKIDSPLVASDGDTSQGLMLLSDDEDFATLALATDGSNIHLIVETVTGGVGTTVLDDTDFSQYQNPLYLRLTKTGSSYVTFYSVDGASWVPVASFINTKIPTLIGPFASNYSEIPSKAFPVVMSVNWFHVQ